MGLDICHVTLSRRNENTIDHLLVSDFDNHENFIKNHSDKIINIDGEDVIFYKELGYLRKQVHSNYLKEFKNEKLYFKKVDVQNFKKYLKSNDVAKQSDLEEYFESNFINNFREGESIFFFYF